MQLGCEAPGCTDGCGADCIEQTELIAFFSSFLGMSLRVSACMFVFHFLAA